MIRNLLGLVLALVILSPATAEAQYANDITGTYVHAGTGGLCSVQRAGNLYLFETSAGTRAYFRIVNPAAGQLAIVEHDGHWYDNVQVSVQREPLGRVRLYFATPGVPRSWGDVWRQVY